MRTTLDMPDDLMKQAKIAAVERGVTLRDLMAEGLRKTLADKLRTGKRLKLPVVKLPEGHKIPVLANRQIAELFDAEDIAHLNELPEPLKKFVDSQVKQSGYGVSDYMRDLIRDHQKRIAGEQLRTLIAEGLASGAPTPVNKPYWTAKRKKLGA